MGTHYKGSDETKVTLDAFIKLTRASESVNSRLARYLAEEKLTISQFGTLEALMHLGPLNQRELGRKLLKSGGNITMVIDNLEKNGMVKRRPNPDDRRAVIVDLTTKGRRFIEEYFPKHLEKIIEEFSVLTTKEKQQLAAICKKLGVREE